MGVYLGIPLKRVDMVAARAAVAVWEAENPKPTPPMVRPTKIDWALSQVAEDIFDRGGVTRKEAKQMALDGAEPVADVGDEGYLNDLKAWEGQEFFVLEQFFWRHGIVYGDERQMYELVLGVIKDGEKRVGLFRAILGMSEITRDAVVAEAERLGVRWNGLPVMQAAEGLPKDGLLAMGYTAMGGLAARDSGMVLGDFERLPIKEQVGILALWLCDRYSQALDYEKRKRESASKR